MSELDITQEEGDRLFQMEKFFKEAETLVFPDFGGKLTFNFVSFDGRELFTLNFTKNSINLVKRNHQIRGRRVIGLARLDLYGPSHRNPDGTEIGSNHIHIYREGFGLKWACEIPAEHFSDIGDQIKTLEDFMSYCNVVDPPSISRGLFS